MTAKQSLFTPATFTVRNADGQLEYANISDLARAYSTGMIDADDEIRDGDGKWTRADDFARQRSLPLPERPKKLGGYAKHAALGTALGALVIFLFAKGQMIAALGLGVIVCLLLTRVTVSAYKPRPRL